MQQAAASQAYIEALQARADAELGADGEPLPVEPRDETSFRSLLAELDGMEQGLKTDFDDLLELPEVPEPAALEAVSPAPVADLVALEGAPELDADAEEEAALARAIAAEALERMRD